MGHGEYQYLRLLRECLEEGVHREGRNGGTYGVFGRQIRFDLKDGFPLLTTKKMFFKGIVVELLWFLRGDTNIRWLQEHGVHIWDEWADENGDLGPVYGKQWRSWPDKARSFRNGEGFAVGGVIGGKIDQIANVIDGLKKDPHGRRHIVTAWNPAEVDDMALPPCHCLFQFHVANGRLNCQLYQRSADIFLGVPFNIASYALLTHIIAREVGLEPGEFVHTFGDLHLYANHVEQAKVQLERKPWKWPFLHIANIARIEGDDVLPHYEPHNIVIGDYRSHDAIKAEVSK